MKKLLVLAALSMAAAPAMASKARVEALGNDASLVDIQTAFVNPADMMFVGDQATFEFGSSSTAGYTYDGAGGYTASTTPHAEGGFFKTLSWGKVGPYLGHKNDTSNLFIDRVNNTLAGAGFHSTTGALLNEQNPLDLFYGNDMGGLKYGVNVHYSNSQSQDNTTIGKQTENTLGASFGVRSDVWNAWVRAGLAGDTKSTDLATYAPELKSKGLYGVGGGYWFDTIYVYANYQYAKGTSTIAGTDQDITNQVWSLGMVNNHKVEGGNFFYGISYAYNQIDAGSTVGKTTDQGLPLIMGLEVDANSWLTLRGSVTQTVLYGENKTEAAATTKDQLTNDTVVAAGAGIKWGKINLDATLAGAVNGQVNGNNLLANGSLTYMF